MESKLSKLIKIRKKNWGSVADVAVASVWCYGGSPSSSLIAWLSWWCGRSPSLYLAFSWSLPFFHTRSLFVSSTVCVSQARALTRMFKFWLTLIVVDSLRVHGIITTNKRHTWKGGLEGQNLNGSESRQWTELCKWNLKWRHECRGSYTIASGNLNVMLHSNLKNKWYYSSSPLA